MNNSIIYYFMKEIEPLRGGKGTITDSQRRRLFNMHNELYPHVAQRNTTCVTCIKTVLNRMFIHFDSIKHLFEKTEQPVEENVMVGKSVDTPEVNQDSLYMKAMFNQFEPECGEGCTSVIEKEGEDVVVNVYKADGKMFATYYNDDAVKYYIDDVETKQEPVVEAPVAEKPVAKVKPKRKPAPRKKKTTPKE